MICADAMCAMPFWYSRNVISFSRLITINDYYQDERDAMLSANFDGDPGNDQSLPFVQVPIVVGVRDEDGDGFVDGTTKTPSTVATQLVRWLNDMYSSNSMDFDPDGQSRIRFFLYEGFDDGHGYGTVALRLGDGATPGWLSQDWRDNPTDVNPAETLSRKFPAFVVFYDAQTLWLGAGVGGMGSSSFCYLRLYTYSRDVVSHEMGHALWMQHPFGEWCPPDDQTPDTGVDANYYHSTWDNFIAWDEEDQDFHVIDGFSYGGRCGLTTYTDGVDQPPMWTNIMSYFGSGTSTSGTSYSLRKHFSFSQLAVVAFAHRDGQRYGIPLTQRRRPRLDTLAVVGGAYGGVSTLFEVPMLKKDQEGFLVFPRAYLAYSDEACTSPLTPVATTPNFDTQDVISITIAGDHSGQTRYFVAIQLTPFDFPITIQWWEYLDETAPDTDSWRGVIGNDFEDPATRGYSADWISSP